VEAVSRVIKNELNEKLRQQMRELKVPMEVHSMAMPFLHLICLYLDAVSENCY
jgi:hypothetical protein